MSLKEQVHELADQLAEGATWDDVAYQVYVRQSIEEGLADIAAGRTVPVEEVKIRLQQMRQQQRANSLKQ